MTVLGLLVALSAVVVYLVLAFVVHRTYPTWWYDMAIAVGMVLAAVGWLIDRQTWITALTVAVGIAWFALSRTELGLDGSARLNVDVGDAIPPFRVRTADEESFSDVDLVAAAPALLVLYRGWWCPYCTTQLDELRREHELFASVGVRVFAVSVDPPDKTVELRRRLDGTIEFLCDEDGSLLDAIGVRDSRGAAWYDRLIFGAGRGDISLPAVLLVDADGSIRYAYRSPRIDVRPSPQEIVAI